MTGSKNRPFVACFGVLALAALAPSRGMAATASIDPADIVQIWHNLDTTRGPSGRAWIMLDRHFTLAGNCVYAGAVDNQSGRMIEFDVEKAST